MVGGGGECCNDCVWLGGGNAAMTVCGWGGGGECCNDCVWLGGGGNAAMTVCGWGGGGMLQ